MVKLTNETEENIRVIVRIKPNTGSKYETIITTQEESNTIIVPDKANFTFDKVASGCITQEDMFDSCKSLFQSFIDGYNATIFAYGQTGSGKTFTMSGDNDSIGSTQNPGLIPRGLTFIFDKANERKLSNSVDYLIKCSFVEIYNEQIYDLLDSQLQRLNIRINVSNEAYLEQCTELIMESPKMASEILRKGLRNRHMASTEMNRESSRSHAVFTIVLESRHIEGDVASIKKSCLHLVDLAGSERQRDSKTEGIRLKEAGMINKSLLALSMVIRKLADASKSNKAAFIAYRDSKLTLLLKDAIGGNSKTSLVACVHNDIRFVAETMSTLQFASSVKMIKNTAKINVDVHGDNESLRREISRLREQLADYKLPQKIQPMEFDCDLVWKKRFVTAMAMKSSLNLDVSTLNDQISNSNTVIIELEKTNDLLKVELELKDKKIMRLETKLTGAEAPNDDIEKLINSTLSKLNVEREDTAERVKSNQLLIQVKYYSNELIKSKNLNALSVSDQTLIHSLMNDFNTIVESGDIKKTMPEFNIKDSEISQLKQDLSALKTKQTALLSTLKSVNASRRDERRQLEATICSLKCRLKIADEQREVAISDRRKTLITVQKSCSPIRQSRSNKLIDVSEEVFISPEEFFKQKNDNYLSHLDKIGDLENQLCSSHVQIGTLKYDIDEYKKEIEELRIMVASNANLQNNFNDLKEKYNATNMTLLEANETVKKLEKDIVALEVSKDKTINIFSEKTFSLEEELKNMEVEKEMYRDESERLKVSLFCLKDEMKRYDDLLVASKLENVEIYSLLKSQISENKSVHEHVERLKKELLNAQKISEQYETEVVRLQQIVDKCNADECKMNTSIAVLTDEIKRLTNNNEVFKTFPSAEELERIMTEKQMYEMKSNKTIACLQETINRLENTVFLCEQENSKKDTAISMLNGELSQKIIVLDEYARLKEEFIDVQDEVKRSKETIEQCETEKLNLQQRIDDYIDNYNQTKIIISSLKEEIEGLQTDNINLSEINDELQNIELDQQIVITELKREAKDKIEEMESKFKTKVLESNRILDEKEDQLLQLSDEVEALKTQIEDFEKENVSLKHKNVNDSEGSGIPFFLRSPLQNSSPLMAKLNNSSNSQRLILEDMIDSHDKSERMLKEEHEKVELINELLEQIFKVLQLPLNNSLVSNMTTLKSMLSEYQEDLEDIVIKKLLVEERLKCKSEECKEMLEVLKSSDCQRNAFKMLLNDLVNDVSNAELTEVSEKIKYLVNIKDTNVQLREENMCLIEEKHRIRTWLHENNYLRLFESSLVGDAQGHYLFNIR